VYLKAGDIEVLLATLTQLRLHLPAWQAGLVFGAATVGRLLASAVAPHVNNQGWRRCLAGAPGRRRPGQRGYMGVPSVCCHQEANARTSSWYACEQFGEQAQDPGPLRGAQRHHVQSEGQAALLDGVAGGGAARAGSVLQIVHGLADHAVGQSCMAA
jgi:hypothetical protein